MDKNRIIEQFEASANKPMVGKINWDEHIASTTKLIDDMLVEHDIERDALFDIFLEWLVSQDEVEEMEA